MTASVHKLTAGSGYDYLTRQVAAHDSTGVGRGSLASYYSDKGEAPGAWLGGGLVGLGDVLVGDEVTAEQMRALFGHGMHPNAEARLAALPAGARASQVKQAQSLGRRFPVHEQATGFQREVAARCAVWEGDHPQDGSVPVPVPVPVPESVKSEIRSVVAGEMFAARTGRLPVGAELSSEVARLSRGASTACAGYDVTFTPVKSVSALWAVAPAGLAARIEQAHQAAVADALRFLEQHALYSREGAGGVRQVDVTGLVAAAFIHRDSRAGDPNLHTHVAIANKVQTLAGKWLAIDGRMVFKAKVSVSETYNSQLEAHLAAAGIRFSERAGGDPSKRPVREVVGVPEELCQTWSSRRKVIVVRQRELETRFQRDHHRPPTPVEALKLAQQATLETRDAKHEPRSLAEQRSTWRRQAEDVIGEQGIEAMLVAATSSGQARTRVTQGWIDQTAAQIVATVEGSRAAWQGWHVRAEASRRVREHVLDPATTEALTVELQRRALLLCIPIDPAEVTPSNVPGALKRRDGASVYSVAGARLYTSQRIVAAEQRIVQLAGRADGFRATDLEVSLAMLTAQDRGLRLNRGQSDLVRRMVTSGARVQLALAAAGSGKTTALRVLGEAWKSGGGNVLGLAPSAVAAGLLREQVGAAITVAKLVWDLDHQRAPEHVIGASTLVVIDEAGMVDTVSLARVVDHVVGSGGSVRLIGDDQQLAAVNAGGVLRDLAATYGAVELTEIMRFSDPAEGAASVALREGRPEALGFYLDARRIHAGTRQTSIESALRGWVTDVEHGRDALMLASTNDTVAELNRLARNHLHAAATPHGLTASLADGNHASRGDVIVTRLNARGLRVSATDWVKNGDRWNVEHVTQQGVRARHRDSGLVVMLPAAYVAQRVQLGYAVTIHCAQGATVDTTHGVLQGTESRQQLYVMMTRGRDANHVHASVLADTDSASPHSETLRPRTVVEVLEDVLARDESARSAASETRDASEARAMLGRAAARYLDGLHLAAEKLHGSLHIPDAAGDGPLPWLPRVPHPIATHPVWGPYLAQSAEAVASLAGAVRAQGVIGAPVWLRPGMRITRRMMADVELWRVANAVDDSDRRPTGPRLPDGPGRAWQQELDAMLVPVADGWDQLLTTRHPQTAKDSFHPTLASHLRKLDAEGEPAAELLRSAASQGPLPAEHSAAALWWRITRLRDKAKPAEGNVAGANTDAISTAHVRTTPTASVPGPGTVSLPPTPSEASMKARMLHEGSERVGGHHGDGVRR